MELNTLSVGDGPKLALVLHGILGSSRNWSTFAKSLSAQRPQWRFELVDLRAHGRSPSFTPPHTLSACAADLRRLVSSLGVQPQAVIGHSFGGKVALAYAQDYPQGLEQVWVLDSPPGAMPGGMEDSEVVMVMRALRSVPLPLSRREELLPLLQAQGLSRALGLWMTTNLHRKDGGLVWRFDLDVVTQLISDYFERDFWPLLERPPAGPQWHILQAQRSDRWTQRDAERLASLPAWSQVHHHLLPDSGHWVHVDNPQGLAQLLLATL